MNIEARHGYVGLALALVNRPAKARKILTTFANRCGERLQPIRLAEILARPLNLDIDWALAEAHLEWESNHSDNHLLLPHDCDFPLLLQHVDDCPSVLFLRGSRAALGKPQVAIVGSRKATHHGLANAHDLATFLAQAGFVVTSGMALGIDAECHQAALQAGGETVAVLGCGVNVDYPRRHRSLREDIAAQGAIVSEFPLNTSPKPFHFPRRNRIISGLSIGVIVVEATRKSGSLTTALHAAEQGREVYAVPGSIRHSSSAGCNQLIAEGAHIVFESEGLLESLRQAAKLHFPDFQIQPYALSRAASETGSERYPAKNIKSSERRLLSLMGPEPIGFDQLVTLSGLTSSELSSILSSLEIAGIIHALAGNTYSLA